MLTSLIHHALVGDQELKILAEDVQVASNVIIAWQGAYVPFVTIGAGAGLNKPTLDTPEGAIENQLYVVPGQHLVANWHSLTSFVRAKIVDLLRSG